MDLYNLHNPTTSAFTQQAAASQPVHSSEPAGTARDLAAWDDLRAQSQRLASELERLRSQPAGQQHAGQDRARELERLRAQPAGQQHAGQDLARELEKARSHALHWENETKKMDRIARAAMEKLEAKREARKALKAELDAARKDADAWRSKCAAHLSRNEPDEGLRKELAQARKELAAAQDEAARARKELALHEAERPLVQERLQTGGEAFRKLKALEPRLRESELHEKQLRAQLNTLQADADAKARQGALDVAAVKEKLRAATQDASARRAHEEASVAMLVRANQVLETCSQLFTAKPEHQELAQALRETTATLEQFLATSKAPRPDC
jgi:hypothetical protein